MLYLCISFSKIRILTAVAILTLKKNLTQHGNSLRILFIHICIYIYICVYANEYLLNLCNCSYIHAIPLSVSPDREVENTIRFLIPYKT